MSGTARTSIGPEEILTTVQGSIALQRTYLSPIQRAGLWLALGVGLLITVVTLSLVRQMAEQTPPAMQFPTPVSLASGTPAYNPVATSVADYKALSEISITRATGTFDTVVVRAFLPIFATILGYIFGAQAGQATANRNQNNDS